MRRRVLVVTLTLLAVAPAAWAQTLDDSYAVELTRGPVTGPAQVVGMAGAVTSLAAGAGAQTFNPAAVANRYEYNPDEFFDWDLEFDGFFTQIVPFRLDLENNGITSDTGGDDVAEISTALALNFGRLGVGFTGAATRYSFADDGRTYTVFQIAPTVGYNFFDGQLVVGAGGQLAMATLKEQVDLLRMLGFGFLGGVIYRPQGLPIRAGASFSTGLIYGNRTQLVDTPPVGVTLVRGLEVPWQVSLGLSGTIGPRWKNYNRSFGDSAKAKAAVNRPRLYVTLSGDVVFMGPTDKSVGFEAWAQDTLQPAGEDLTIGFRLGADSEFWQNRMRGRLGYYYEPSRFQGIDGRHHGTAGMDVYLFDFIFPWRFTWAVDVAPRYANVNVSLGVWH
ncbi:MAG: hypothetical protein H6730_28680 [Deltaproteobacteria bacterium]|nr:hypothetical protein [Deltaproteobacteria bacterium]